MLKTTLFRPCRAGGTWVCSDGGGKAAEGRRSPRRSAFTITIEGRAAAWSTPALWSLGFGWRGAGPGRFEAAERRKKVAHGVNCGIWGQNDASSGRSSRKPPGNDAGSSAPSEACVVPTIDPRLFSDAPCGAEKLRRRRREESQIIINFEMSLVTSTPTKWKIPLLRSFGFGRRGGYKMSRLQRWTRRI